MRALSIRQPYAELILRGIKPIEFWFDRLTAGRSRRTKMVRRGSPQVIGERFYIYASKQWAVSAASLTCGNHLLHLLGARYCTAACVCDGLVI